MNIEEARRLMLDSTRKRLENKLEGQLKAHKLPAPKREYLFARPRLFRFDFAWPEHRVAAEVEGGIWSGGRHVRPTGFQRDTEKYNLATEMGWRVFRFTSKEIGNGGAAMTLVRVLRNEER